MGGKSSAPAAPDLSGYTAALRENGREANAIAQKNLDFQQEIYNKNLPAAEALQADAVSAGQAGVRAAERVDKMAADEYEMYQKYANPSQRAMAVDSWGGANLSPEDRARLAQALENGDETTALGLRNRATNNMVNEATGQVQASGNNAMAQQTRGLTRLGGDPNKMAAYASAVGLGNTAAIAGAANQTRLAARDRSTAALGTPAGLGANAPALYSASSGLRTSGIAGRSAALGTSMSMGNGVSSAYGGQINARDMNMQAEAGVMGAKNQQYAQQSANVNAKNGQDAALVGAVIGAGGMMAMSDPRTKENVERVGTTVHNLGWYEFNYIDGHDDKRYRGVMSDEVRMVMPDAVIVGDDGFDRVDYAMLGIQMEEV